MGQRVALVVALLVFTSPARAEEPSRALDSLAWELAGGPMEAEGLFATDSTVYVIGNDGLFVIRPSEEVWTLVADYRDVDASRDVSLTDTGIFFATELSLVRSTDGGQTWTESLDQGELPPIYTPGGALITNRDAFGPTIARSTNDGQFWTLIEVDPAFNFFPETFATLPISDSLPTGRLLAGGNNGLLYSDDDGFTWAATSLFAAFAYRTISIIRAPWGLVYAAVNDFEGEGGVWESADGIAWTRVGQVPNVGGTGGQLLAVGDSTLYGMHVSEDVDLQVYVSRDRGRTWAGTGVIAAEAEIGNELRLRELVVGPEGHLWLSMDGSGAGSTGGVFRTVEAVVPVAVEPGIPEPSEETGAVLEVAPNPFREETMITLVLDRRVEVVLAVYDALGRCTGVLHDGVLAAGRHAFGLAARDLANGVYILQLDADGQSFTRRVTLLR